ncbi:MAG: 1,4-alpha-glucan branching protein domain-containing protein [Candidatus Hodarchaeota archaeon]
MAYNQEFGSLAFVLHSHLPYVLYHGTWPHGMSWLNEAAAETYIPLLEVLHRLKEEGYTPHLTIGLSPVLVDQLSSSDFVSDFCNYLEERLAASQDDRDDFTRTGQEHRAYLAEWWESHYSRILEYFENSCNRDIVGSFRHLQDDGTIEIITCAATHGYLPLLGTDDAVRNQVHFGRSIYRKHFGADPRGIWLPECAYRPRYVWKSPIDDVEPFERAGVEEILAEENIDYFIVDAHLLTGGEARGVYIERFAALKMLWEQFKDQYKPTKDFRGSPYEFFLVDSQAKKPVAFFVRDPETGLLVWSGEHGYPGDGWYLDFHKKHWPSGNRYWRVTAAKADLADKWEYEPDKILDRVNENASHFKEKAKELLRNASRKPAIVCAPFDTELFGHWWFEGPIWLERVLRWVEDDPEISLTTCGDFLQRNPPQAAFRLPEGSWGRGGHHFIWLNEWTAWTWQRIYECERQFPELAKKATTSNNQLAIEVATQALRELLLLESSDWQFLISTWSARDYAESRVALHFERFKQLAQFCKLIIEGHSLSKEQSEVLRTYQEEDRIFPDLKLEE